MVGFIAALLVLILYALGSSLAPYAQDRLMEELRRQFGPFESLEVRILTDPPFRVTQGQVDQLRIDAKGFRVQGVPVASLWVRSEAIALNTPRLLFAREVDLVRPTGAIASLSFTERGLNEVLKQPQVARSLRGVPVKLTLFPGMTVTQNVDVVPQGIDVQDGRLQVTGQVVLPSGVNFPFQVSGRPVVAPPSRLFIVDAQASMMGGPVDPSLLAGALREPVLDLANVALPEGVGFSLFDVLLASDSVTVRGRVDLKGLLGRL